MNRRRILMVGPSISGLGGISRVVRIWQENSFFDKYNVTYIPTSAGNSQIGKFLMLLHGLFRFLSLLKKNRLTYVHTAIDVSFYRKSLFLGMSIFFKIPVLLHVHPTAFIEFIKQSRKIKRKYILFLLHRVRCFVVLTNEMKYGIESMLPGKPVFVLCNPVSIQEMRRDPAPRAANKLIYLGWYVKEKGVYELVDAVRIIKNIGINVGLDLYGIKGRTQLNRYVQERGLTDIIEVNGWIEHREAVSALHAHTMLVLPSHTEGIPNVILEAMATKTPIVATSVGGMKEILRDGENSLIAEVNNPVDLSAKICQLLQDSDLRNRLAENAYRDAVEKYDIGVIKEQFSRIIQSAVKEA